MQGIATLPYEVVEEEVELPLVPDNGIHTLKDAADMLADFGRRGDIYIAHVAEGETVIPLPVLNANPKMKKMIWQQFEEMGIDPEQYIVGTELNMTNPATGVREFGFFSGIKKVFKKVKKVVKKVVKKIKPILKAAIPLVIGLAAPYLLPAAPLWLSGGLGSLAGSFIAGERDPKALALSFGLGAAGGAFKSKFMNGPEGSWFGSKANPGASFMDFGGEAGGGIANLGTALTPSNPLNPETWGLTTFNPLSDSSELAPVAPSDTLAGAGSSNIASNRAVPAGRGGIYDTTQLEQQIAAGQQPSTSYFGPGQGQIPIGDGTYVAGDQYAMSDPNTINYATDASPVRDTATSYLDMTGGNTPIQSRNLTGSQFFGDGYSPSSNVGASPTLGEPPNWFERNIWDSDPNIGGQGEGWLESYISPNRSSIQPTAEDYGRMGQAMGDAEAAYLLKKGEAMTPAMREGLEKQYMAGMTPGPVRKYWPMAALGTAGAVGADYLTDGKVLGLWTPNEDTDGDGVPDAYRAPTGELYYNDPTKYGYGSDFYGDNPYYTQEHVPTYVQQQPVQVAGGGEIVGPGTSTSDSIPALLSDGEFVVNAATVEGIGGGDRKEGAKKLYAMQRAYDQRVA